MADELKAQIVKIARRMLKAGLVVGSLGNVSARNPERLNVIYITPAGLPYERMSPSDITTIDLGGRVLAGGKPSSEWRLHTAIYRRRPDVNAVVHAHGTYAQAWSFLGEPLPARTEELKAFAGGDISVAPYAPSGTQELANNAIKALQDRSAVLLARHGIVAVGQTLEEALIVAQIVERQAQVAWLLRLAAFEDRPRSQG